MKPVLAWHFLANDRCLHYGDHPLIETGKTITVDCKPKLCESGLHGSRRAIDALNYAPGPIVCRVELSGKVVEGEDKLAATSRRCIAIEDATNLLHEFSCWCAESALTRWEKRNSKKADKRSWNAIKVKRKWLSGNATSKELAAARDKALAAARDKALTAVWDEALAAAWDEASAAAWAAAWDVALAAARASAWDATGAAEIERQNVELETRLFDLLEIQEAQQ